MLVNVHIHDGCRFHAFTGKIGNSATEMHVRQDGGSVTAYFRSGLTVLGTQSENKIIAVHLHLPVGIVAGRVDQAFRLADRDGGTHSRTGQCDAVHLLVEGVVDPHAGSQLVTVAGTDGFPTVIDLIAFTVVGFQAHVDMRGRGDGLCDPHVVGHGALRSRVEPRGHRIHAPFVATGWGCDGFRVECDEHWRRVITPSDRSRVEFDFDLSDLGHVLLGWLAIMPIVAIGFGPLKLIAGERRAAL